jgi:hypothetical protein
VKNPVSSLAFEWVNLRRYGVEEIQFQLKYMFSEKGKTTRNPIKVGGLYALTPPDP